MATCAGVGLPGGDAKPDRLYRASVRTFRPLTRQNAHSHHRKPVRRRHRHSSLLFSPSVSATAAFWHQLPAACQAASSSAALEPSTAGANVSQSSYSLNPVSDAPANARRMKRRMKVSGWNPRFDKGHSRAAGLGARSRPGRLFPRRWCWPKLAAAPCCSVAIDAALPPLAATGAGWVSGAVSCLAFGRQGLRAPGEQTDRRR